MPTTSVGIVIYSNDSVLLVKHAQKAKLPTGHYGFLAGILEPDENLKDAAIRELQEETGLTASKEHLQKLSEKRSFLKTKKRKRRIHLPPFPMYTL